MPQVKMTYLAFSNFLVSLRLQDPYLKFPISVSHVLLQPHTESFIFYEQFSKYHDGPFLQTHQSPHVSGVLRIKMFKLPLIK